MIEGDDWRLRGQDEYSQNGSLHARCEFCWHKFMENPDGVKDCSKQGYCSIDGKYWICEDCFNDFRKKFNWKS